MLHRLETPRARTPRTQRQTWQVAARSVIHEQGGWGKTWKLLEGAVRLDETGPPPAQTAPHTAPHTQAQGPAHGHGHFVRLVLPGQLIGAETLLKKPYSFRAQTVVPCVLTPWPTLPDADVTPELLASFVDAYCEQGEQMRLCHGTAESRLAHLLSLITRAVTPDAQGGRLLNMPGLRDLADITDLTMETVSRCITRLRQTEALEDLGRRQFRLLVDRLPGMAEHAASSA